MPRAGVRDYITLSDSTEAGLDIKVNEKIALGWQPHGDQYRSATGMTEFYQVMARSNTTFPNKAEP